MWSCARRSFNSADEAIDFIESVGEGDYTVEATPGCKIYPEGKKPFRLSLTVLTFKNAEFICNFDPEEPRPPKGDLFFEEPERKWIMPMAASKAVVKSRLVSVHDLACQALNTHTYLDMKRLRRELRMKFPDHADMGRWAFDPVDEEDICERIKKIVLRLEKKPRRNRRSTKPVNVNPPARSSRRKRRT